MDDSTLMNNFFTERELNIIARLSKTTTQICKKCKVEQKLSAFVKDCRGTNGRGRVCKKCLGLTTGTKKENLWKYNPKTDRIEELSPEETKKIRNETLERVMNRRKHYKKKKLNKPFVGSEAHHINKEYTIHIPKALHNFIGHNLETGHCMKEMNTIAFNYLLEHGDGILLTMKQIYKIRDEVFFNNGGSD